MIEEYKVIKKFVNSINETAEYLHSKNDSLSDETRRDMIIDFYNENEEMINDIELEDWNLTLGQATYIENSYREFVDEDYEDGTPIWEDEYEMIFDEEKAPTFWLYLNRIIDVFEEDFKKIDFEVKDQEYQIDLNDSDSIKKMFKNFNNTIMEMQNNNDKNTESLNLEVNLLKEKINNLSKEISVSSAIELKENIIDHILKIVPMAEKVFSGYKIATTTVKLIAEKIK